MAGSDEEALFARSRVVARTQGGRGTTASRRSSAFLGLGCPKSHREIEDSLVRFCDILNISIHVVELHRNLPH